MLSTVREAAKLLLRPMEEADLIYEILSGTRSGTLFEVGAHHGDGPLQRFADDGWTVHAFEPDPENRAHLEAVARRYANVHVVPKAVGAEPGALTLYRSSESSGISSLTAFTPEHEPVGEVPVVTLRDYVQQAGVHEVTFLKVDVEGHEKFVLEGFPWETHNPEAVLLEFEDSKTMPLGYSWRDLAEFLVAKGFDVFVSEWYPIERYGIEHRFREVRRYPTDLADPQGWGNLIGVRTRADELERRVGRATRRAALRRSVLNARARLRGR